MSTLEVLEVKNLISNLPITKKVTSSMLNPESLNWRLNTEILP